MIHSELRLGNKVLYTFPTVLTLVPQIPSIGTVASISAIKVTVAETTGLPIEVEPIPLTPEILEKCGFVKSVEAYAKGLWDYIYQQGTFQLYCKEHGVEVEFAPTWSTLEERSHVCTVQYLHQLQNLFYCLTQKELTITL